MTFNTETHEELAINHEISPVLIEMARCGLLKFGKLSVPYLMRKLKVSASMAKEMIEVASRATSDNETYVRTEKF